MNFLVGMIDYLEYDYNEKVIRNREWDSYLYNLFHDENGYRETTGNLDYYNEAVNMFAGNPTRVFRPSVNRYYNNTQNRVPIFVVDMPGEQMAPYIENNFDSFVNPLAIDSDFTEQNSRRFNTTFTIWCIGNNESQVEIMYHVLRGFLVGNPTIIEYMGFQNFSFRGTDILKDEMKEPQHLILKRGMAMFFNYQESAPAAVGFKFPKSIKFTPKPE